VRIAIFHIENILGQTSPSALRGAMGAFVLEKYKEKAIEQKYAELFTNKDFNTLKPIEAYAKIQFRLHRGNNLVWAIEDGISAMRSLLNNDVLENFSLNGKIYKQLIITEDEYDEEQPKFTSETYNYTLRNYVPFNADTVKSFEQITGVANQIKRIEKLIQNELVLFSYAAKWELKKDQIMSPVITKLEPTENYIYTTRDKNSGAKITHYEKQYDIEFACNCIVPGGIGIGRHKSYGSGVLEAN